jgi:hypothetical protein
MNKRPPVKKPQAKIQTVKKQIPVKKIAPDRIEELVKKHLGNIGEAENAFKSASALLEKHKTKYPELERYIEHVSPSDRSIQMLDDVKDPRRISLLYLKSYLPGWSRHIRSHIREKRITPTWIERPGFPLLKRLWQKRSFTSCFHGKPSRLLKR